MDGPLILIIAADQKVCFVLLRFNKQYFTSGRETRRNG